MNVGQRIREAREDLGMPQTVLARRVGVARNTIGRYESGEHEPSFAMLEKIARELRTEPAEFLRTPVPLAQVAASGEEPGPAQASLESEEVLLYKAPYTASDFDELLGMALDFTRGARADYLERGMRLVLTDDGESVEVRAVPLAGSPSRGRSARSSASRRKKVES